MRFDRRIQLFQYVELELRKLLLAVQLVLHPHAVISNTSEIQFIDMVTLTIYFFRFHVSSGIGIRMLCRTGVIYHSVHLFRNVRFIPRIIFMHALDIYIYIRDPAVIIVQIQLCRHVDRCLETRYGNRIDHSCIIQDGTLIVLTLLY